MHWSQLFKPAKALCYNMITYLHHHVRLRVNYKTKCFILPPCVIQDLKFWLLYVKQIKRVPMSFISNEPTMKIFGSSDASDTGAGFCMRKKWSYYRFSHIHRTQWHKRQKEAHAVIMLLYNL